MKNNSSAFANQLLICLLVTICIGGSIGVGTVWFRHQISTTAKSNRDLAAEVARLERLIDEQKTLLETEQTPDKLRGLNAALRLGLVPMSEIPVLHVTENVVERMAHRANRDLFTEAAARSPRGSRAGMLTVDGLLFGDPTGRAPRQAAGRDPIASIPGGGLWPRPAPPPPIQSGGEFASGSVGSSGPIARR
jgi:hypothetical protein